jgi:hypothetical protein
MSRSSPETKGTPWTEARGQEEGRGKGKEKKLKKRKEKIGKKGKERTNYSSRRVNLHTAFPPFSLSSTIINTHHHHRVAEK